MSNELSGIRIEDVLRYEIESSLWAGWLTWEWAQDFAAWYYSTKARRKWGRMMRQRAIWKAINEMGGL